MYLPTCLKYAATIWMPNFPLTLEVYPTEADTKKVIETSTETLFRSPWWIRPHWSIFNWAEFDFRPMSLFQIGALRYLKGILCKRLKKKNIGQGYFEEKSLLYFLRERDYNFFVHFRYASWTNFPWNKKGKLYLGIQFFNFTEKTHFPLAGFQSSSSRGFQNFPVSSWTKYCQRFKMTHIA